MFYNFYTVHELKYNFIIAPRSDDWRQIITESDIKEMCVIAKDKIYNPLYIWNGYIMDGRKRYHAAIKLQAKYTVPVIHFDNYQECIIAIIQTNTIKLRELIRYFTYHNDEKIVNILSSRFGITKPNLFKYIEKTPEIACKLFDYGLLSGDDIVSINHYALLYAMAPYQIYHHIFNLYVSGKSYKKYLKKIYDLKL